MINAKFMIEVNDLSLPISPKKLLVKYVFLLKKEISSVSSDQMERENQH